MRSEENGFVRGLLRALPGAHFTPGAKSEPKENALRGLWGAGSKWSLLVWWPLVELFESYDDDLKALFRGPLSLRFPDGSVCLETTAEIHGYFLKLKDYGPQEVKLGEISTLPELPPMSVTRCLGSGLKIRDFRFRSLACFKRRGYLFVTPWSYFNRIGGEEGFSVWPGESTPVFPEEQHPGNLKVRVHFWRAPSKGALCRFQSDLETWSASVKTRGMFGDGPARLLNAPEYSKKWFAFYVDLSQSGQHTVNWLTLTLLNCGNKYGPITQVRYVQPAGPGYEYLKYTGAGG
jgi:hypothetical protein